MKINIETPNGERLKKELRGYSEVVEFVEYPFPADSHANKIETISVAESAQQAFEKLGQKYNCRFENKYTRS